MVHIPSVTGTSRGQVVGVAGGDDAGTILDSVLIFDVDAATWNAATAMPGERINFGVAHIPAQHGGGGGDVMTLGGRNGSAYLNSVCMYNVDADTWSEPTATPVASYGLSMVHIPAHIGGGRGLVMVAGGYAAQTTYLADQGFSIGDILFDSVYMYNVDTKIWNKTTAMPVARAYFGMVYIPAQDGGGGGDVMVAGGRVGKPGCSNYKQANCYRLKSSEILDSVHMYNVDTKKWRGTSTMPAARFYFGMVHIPAQNGGRGGVVVAGGKDSDKTLDSVYMYSVGAATWRALTGMPDSRRNFDMVYIPTHTGGGGEVMAAGGVGSWKKFMDSVYVSVPVATTTAASTTTTTNTTTTSPAQHPAEVGGLPAYVYGIIAGGSLLLLGTVVFLANVRRKTGRQFLNSKLRHADAAAADDEAADDVPLVDLGHPSIYTPTNAEAGTEVESNLDITLARIYDHQTLGVRSNI